MNYAHSENHFLMSDNEPLEKIRELREARGWTQEQLAERAQLDHGTVSAYERGTRGSIKTLRKLAKALGVPPADLLTTEEARKLMSLEEIIALAIEKAQNEPLPIDRRNTLLTLLELSQKELKPVTK